MKHHSLQIILRCPQETDSSELGHLIAQHSFPGLIILLEGGLGSGKTVFARGFAQGLGIQEDITSPSYPIIQEYDGRLKLYHMDLYRLSSAEEVANTGAAELWGGKDVCLIEWPDRSDYLPGYDSLMVKIQIESDMSRVFRISTTSLRLWERLALPSILPTATIREFLP